ncbi:hypothetical protein SAMN04487963_1811 [Marinobacter zhejiangensis]|uniref:Uncharacterized protein n=2 Tax=Marinobacter zhejiangensis TaxID=488535 RepID=A0A1I4P5C5_9GAMM|nr:hypothetical protein SAMN04487963_1811 [Marinobacter zhejiangensis]
MKRVYDLAEALRRNPEHIKAAQEMTLNVNKPLLGLKGRHGLFGSDQWWESIRSGHLAVKTVSGVIQEMAFAGQDARWGNQSNSFKLKLEDGSVLLESMYAHEKADRKLFRPGATVVIAYVLDELKNQPAQDGGVNYAESVLDMLVSMPSHD